VKPWIERTQWLPYLLGIERADLLACIEELVAEPDSRSDDEDELDGEFMVFASEYRRIHGGIALRCSIIVWLYEVQTGQSV
jgi:hypothetical protein